MYIVSLTAKAHFPDIYFVTLPLNDIEAGTDESRCCCFFFLSDNRTTLPTEEMLRCLQSNIYDKKPVISLFHSCEKKCTFLSTKSCRYNI